MKFLPLESYANSKCSSPVPVKYVPFLAQGFWLKCFEIRANSQKVKYLVMQLHNEIRVWAKYAQKSDLTKNWDSKCFSSNSTAGLWWVSNNGIEFQTINKLDHTERKKNSQKHSINLWNILGRSQRRLNFPRNVSS